jgi:ketosteroid isomerase-like protein
VSRELELLKGGFDALWLRGDWEAGFGALEPDFEWTPPPGLPDVGAGPWRGRKEFERIFREWLDMWEDHEIEYEFTDLEPGRVLAENSVTGRGRASGATVTMATAQIWEFEGGRPVRMRWYLTREEALASLRAQ